jgi:hypothetical protein
LVSVFLISKVCENGIGNLSEMLDTLSVLAVYEAKVVQPSAGIQLCMSMLASRSEQQSVRL